MLIRTQRNETYSIIDWDKLYKFKTTVCGEAFYQVNIKKSYSFNIELYKSQSEKNCNRVYNHIQRILDLRIPDINIPGIMRKLHIKENIEEIEKDIESGKICRTIITDNGEGCIAAGVEWVNKEEIE